MSQLLQQQDALTGAALIMQYMLETGKTLTQLASEIPAYQMSKQKVECSKRAVTPALKELAREKALRVDTQDGVKLDFKNGWVHIRPSNTEPIVRVYAEARTQAEADEIADKYREKVEQFVKSAKKRD